jgi:hypothetical protein
MIADRSRERKQKRRKKDEKRYWFIRAAGKSHVNSAKSRMGWSKGNGNLLLLSRDRSEVLLGGGVTVRNSSTRGEKISAIFQTLSIGPFQRHGFFRREHQPFSTSASRSPHTGRQAGSFFSCGPSRPRQHEHTRGSGNHQSRPTTGEDGRARRPGVRIQQGTRGQGERRRERRGKGRGEREMRECESGKDAARRRKTRGRLRAVLRPRESLGAWEPGSLTRPGERLGKGENRGGGPDGLVT